MMARCAWWPLLWVVCAVAAPLGAVEPVVPQTAAVDVDGDGVGNRLEERLARERRVVTDPRASDEEKRAALGRLAQPVRIEILFRSNPQPIRVQHIESAGGRILYTFEEAAAGFLAEMPLEAIKPYVRSAGPELLLVETELPIEVFQHDAAGGARPWPEPGPQSVAVLDRLPTETPPPLAIRIEPLGMRPGEEPALLEAKAASLRQRGIFACVGRKERARGAARLAEIVGREDIRTVEELLALGAEETVPVGIGNLDDPPKPAERTTLGPQAPLFVRRVAFNEAGPVYWLFDLPEGADFDVEVITAVPETPEREPSFLTLAESARRERGGRETVLFRPGENRQAYVVVRRMEGAGEFVWRTAIAPTPTPSPTPANATPVPSPTPTPQPTPTPFVPPDPFAGNPVGPDAAMDGWAEELGSPVVANDSPAGSTIPALANLRIGHDNDFLYLHVGASLPVSTEAPPPGLWIFFDADDVPGANPVTNNGGAGPPGATAGMEGVVLEPIMEADRLLYLERAPGDDPGRFRVWMLNYPGQTAEVWAAMELSAATATFTPSPEAPVGFASAFDNRGGFVLPTDASVVDTGWELRLPLTALGVEAPLFASTPTQEIRLMVGSGRGDTGAWSNQVLGPIGSPRGPGGGIGQKKPDFEANRRGSIDPGEPFEGVQTVRYRLDYVPRGTFESPGFP